MSEFWTWIFAILLLLLLVYVIGAIFCGWSCAGAGVGSVGKIYRIIPVGVTPHGVAITPCGTYAYVANNNNYDIAGSDSVTVINLCTQKVVTTITDASFDEPYTVTINCKGTKAYVTNSNGETVTVIDIKTNTVEAVIGGFDGPSGLAIVPGTHFAYVNNYGGPGGVGSGNGTTVQKVDLSTNTLVGAPLTVDLAPAAIAASPNGKYVYTINYTDGLAGTGSISIIQTSDESVTEQAYVGLSGPFAIAISRCGKRAYITNFGSNDFAPYGTTISVMKLKDLAPTLVKEVTLGIQPSGIDLYYGKNGQDYAVVSNYNTLYAGAMFTDLTPGQGTVQLVCLSNNKVLPVVIAVSQSPSQVAVHGDHAYITCYTGNTLNVVSLPFYISMQ